MARRTATSRNFRTEANADLVRSLRNGQGSAYIDGNAAPALETAPQERPGRDDRTDRRDRRENSPARESRRSSRRHMSLGAVLFSAMALVVCGMLLVHYVTLTSELTKSVKQVASMESRLNTLKLANDEEYNRVINSVDLEEIKRIAIGELGMTYATEGQVVTYDKAGNDYMRRADDDE